MYILVDEHGKEVAQDSFNLIIFTETSTNVSSILDTTNHTKHIPLLGKFIEVANVTP